MSYDIYLFKKLKNKNIIESAGIVLESNINSLDNKNFEFQKKSLTRKLKFLDGKLEEFNSDNYLELTLNNTGIQISIHPNQIAITVPYWHTNQEAEKVFKKVFNYLNIIKQETGYSIYDPQNGTEIEISDNQDIKYFLKKYLLVSKNINTVPIQKNYKYNYKGIPIGYIIMIVVITFFLIIGLIGLLIKI